MRVILDANIVVALFLPLPFSGQAREHIVAWDRTGLELLAPTLFEYEINSVLHRAATTGLLAHREAKKAMQDAKALAVKCVPPSPQLHDRAWYWADRLNQSKTHDAQYVALAELERADFWTADRRLANGARQAGAAWVHWIGESDAEGL